MKDEFTHLFLYNFAPSCILLASPRFRNSLIQDFQFDDGIRNAIQEFVVRMKTAKNIPKANKIYF